MRSLRREPVDRRGDALMDRKESTSLTAVGNVKAKNDRSTMYRGVEGRDAF